MLWQTLSFEHGTFLGSGAHPTAASERRMTAPKTKVIFHRMRTPLPSIAALRPRAHCGK